ncbi:hypothetical protein [Luteipulveratus halotolerans]|uniref:hypothetical protein n=1 Tax=Luteipulveratus halotolerans TaxID=1631356 RepID=UPI001E628CC6|nr:hypothetical protein [Luteipulveratus halotolerans]
MEDVAWAVVDVARDAGVVAGVVSADHALRVGSVTRDDLERVITVLHGCSRLGRASRMLELMDARSESVGETRLRLLLRGLGIDVETQFEIAMDGRSGACADFRVVGTRVLIEFDGEVKYQGDDGAKVLVAEKHREDGLRRAGWTVVRVVWADLQRPKVIQARIQAALALAA